MARLLSLLFVVLLSGCATTSHPSPARLRYDGVYVGGDYPYGCVENGNLREFYPELWDFLRFYPDGTVIEEIAPMFITPSNSRKYLTKENNHANRRGTYSVDGNRISIVTSVLKRVGDQTSTSDPIRSTGRIDGDYLRLKKFGRDKNSKYFMVQELGAQRGLQVLRLLIGRLTIGQYALRALKEFQHGVRV